jgi:hypothetical protein
VKMPAVNYETFQLKGGLDLVTPTMSLRPGVARSALNFEVNVTGGYSRVAGYERTDGRAAKPSSAKYGSITLANVASITVGGNVSNGLGATGVVIAIVGSRVFFTKQVGTFSAGQTVNGVTTITATGGATTSAERAEYLRLAADVYRADILPVPGSGPVRGVALYGGVLYAWRDNITATALGMYKATTGGWVAVSFGYEVSFNLGSVAPAIGATIVKGPVSAVVRAVCLESGSFAGGTAVGRLIVDAPVGGAFTAGSLTSGGTLTLNSGLAGSLVQAAITLLPGGRVQTFQASFGGGQSKKLYGCDNVNRGWEFDGTTLVPIRTGMTTDKPENVVVHKNYLFYSFGPSVQFSAIGNPYSWSPILGAGELVAADTVTAFSILPGSDTTGALGIFTPDTTHVLYGTAFGAGGDANFVNFNNGLGAWKYTVQNMEQAYALDSRGVVAMGTVKDFGNFDTSTLTLNVRPFIQTHRGYETASGLNREKAQYRVFYSDGYALFSTILNGKYLGSMPVLYPNPVLCWCEGRLTDQTEYSYFGSDDGYIRQMESGNSFDGQEVPFRLHLNFDSIGNQRVLKRYRHAAFEMIGGGYVEFQAGYSLAYNSNIVLDQPPYQTAVGSFSDSATYDSGFTYDSGLSYDGRTLGPAELGIAGTAENISIIVKGTTNKYPVFGINTVTIHYTPRRGMR